MHRRNSSLVEKLTDLGRKPSEIQDGKSNKVRVKSRRQSKESGEGEEEEDIEEERREREGGGGSTKLAESIS